MGCSVISAYMQSSDDMPASMTYTSGAASALYMVAISAKVWIIFMISNPNHECKEDDAVQRNHEEGE